MAFKQNSDGFPNLTTKATPTTSDIVQIADAAASNLPKQSTVGSLPFASKALDNLSGVAINTSLVSDTDVTDDLGTPATRWNNVYAGSLKTGDANADALTLAAYDVDGAAYTTFVTFTAGNTPTCVLSGDITGVTQAANDNTTKLATTAYVDTAGGSFAPVGATYIVQTASGTLTNEQALGALATGIMKSTTTTGVVSIAAAGTDYVAPSTTLTVAGTANEVDVSGGAQDLSANRTWTASLPTAMTFTGKTVTGGTFTAPTINVNDNVFSIRDNGDTTKIAQFECSSITTGTTRTYSVQNASGTLYQTGGTDVALADGGTGASLSDPNADRIMFWDDSGGAVDWLTVGTGLSITGTTITATGGGGGLSAVDQTTTSVTAAINTIYSANNASLVTITLPTTAAFGSQIWVIGQGAGGWLVQNGTGVTTHIGNTASTTTTGAVASTNRRDTLMLFCTVADTTWVAIGGTTAGYTIT